jgi:hypothetical protein
MNLSSNESLLLALFFIVLGFILLQYGMVQGLLLLGLSGLFLLFFISFKIKAKDSVKLYSDFDKAESYLQFWEITAPELKDGRMAILKEDAQYTTTNYGLLLSENYAYGAATYSDVTPIFYGNLISCAKNFRVAIASRFAYERNLASGIYVNESNPKKLLEQTSYINFGSFFDCPKLGFISTKFKQNSPTNIVMCGKSDYAEFDSLVSTFSRKGSLCLLMLESQRLVFYDAKA